MVHDLKNTCKVQIGKPNIKHVPLILESLDLAIAACLGKIANALVTGPVQKSIIMKYGANFSGHTEYIASKTGGEPIMMLHTSNLKIALLTTHIPLLDVPKLITKERLKLYIKIISSELKKKFSIDNPRISICGLNPHAGEDGYIGNEEKHIIAPLIEDMKKEGFNTTNLHSDRADKPEHGVLHKPVHTSVAYGYEKAKHLAEVFQGKRQGYNYGRQLNPTVTALQKRITKMENGISSVAFSTGMAAISSTMLSLLKAGDHVIASSFLFGNTNSFFGTLNRLGIEVSFVDATKAQFVENSIKQNTKIVFVETIANPVTQVADLALIGRICKNKNLVYIVDNTMTSPFLFQPRNVNASLIINSLTKYIGGHAVSYTHL